jgi:replicative DNA helicase
LEVNDFHDESSRKLFHAIQDLNNDGLELNRVSVSERSGIALHELDDLADRASSVTPGQLKTLVAELRRVSGLRGIYDACSQARGSIGKDAKVEEILELLEKGLYRLDRSGATEAIDGADALSGALDELQRRIAGGGGPEISTGLKALDKAIIGLRPGKNIVIAARPGMGKTALADTIRRNVLNPDLQQGQLLGAIQFSLEMSAAEIAERELSNQTGINLRNILAGVGIGESDQRKLDGLGGSIAALSKRWAIDDRTYSISGIRRRARIIHNRMAREGIKTGVVILDYIQLAGENGEGREQSVAAISRGCKLMAKELGCTVLALSQLNRACESRDDRRPLMSDVRESGAIEQDADVVAFVYREGMYDESVPGSLAELIIRKHRSGPTGTVHLQFNEKTASFGDVQRETPVLTERVQQP